MAGGMKGIKQRIKSVRSTMQITKAMELVASSKLRRAKERAERSRPYFEGMAALMNSIGAKGNDSVYLRQRPVKHSLFIVMAGDRGLAGGYNSGAFKLARQAMEGKNALVFAVGRKAVEEYSKEGRGPGAPRLLHTLPEIAGVQTASDLDELASLALRYYTDGEADEVYVVYTRFLNSLHQKPTLQKLLPLAGAQDGEEGPGELTIYDPSPGAVFDAVIPEYVKGILFGAACESFASEQGARRTAMESANDNAKEMIETLSLHYNRARQSAITQEITESVAGANASRGE